MTISTIPLVLERQVLHLRDAAGSDKVYIVETLSAMPGSDPIVFTLYGRRGKGMKSAYHGTGFGAAAAVIQAKLKKGYALKVDTVGLESVEADMAVPMTPEPIYRPYVSWTGAPAPLSPAAPVATGPVDPDPLAALRLELEDWTDAEGQIDAAGKILDGILADGSLRTRATGLAVSADGDGWRVESASVSGTAYRVELWPEPKCSCPFHTARSLPCKHMFAVADGHGRVELAERRKQVRTRIDEIKGQIALAKRLESLGSTAKRVEALRIPGVPGPNVPPHDPNYTWDPVLLEALLVAWKRGKNIMLYGPSGTGKSSTAEAFASLLNMSMYRLNLNGQANGADLIGHPIAKGGETPWIDGLLPRSMREGSILLIDECDFGDPAVLALLHPALEDRPSLCLKENDGELVRADLSRFRIVATANSLGIHDDSGVYAGTNPMNAAFLNRFFCREVPNPSPAQEVTILTRRGIPEVTAKVVSRVSEVIRRMIHVERTVSGAWGIRNSLDMAGFAADFESWEKGFAAAAEGKFTREELTAMWTAAQKITGSVPIAA